MKVEDIILEKMIDKGEHSEVYLSCKEGENIKYVTKKYERALVEGTEYYKRLHKEITIIRNINHQNILKLINLKKTKKHLYAILEYCNGGDLSIILISYLLKYGKPFSQEIVQHLMRQVISGLKYIYDKNLVHGDIKLKSILVHFDTEKDKEELNMMKATIKISHFKNSIDPKIILGKGLNIQVDNQILNYIDKNKKSDIFDLGVMCYKMIFGKYEQNSEDYEKLINDIQEGKNNYPITLSKEILLFMENMLCKKEKRIKFEELSNHIFLTKEVKQYELINAQKNDQNNNLNEKKEEHLCIICFTGTSEIIISPCGHKCICNNCYNQLKGKDILKICPICRKPIISVVEKVFEV